MAAWQEEWNAYRAEAEKDMVYYSDDEVDGDEWSSNEKEDDELFRVPAQAYCSATEREKLESEKEANSEETQKKSFWWIPCSSKQRALAEAFSAL